MKYAILVTLLCLGYQIQAQEVYVKEEKDDFTEEVTRSVYYGTPGRADRPILVSKLKGFSGHLSEVQVEGWGPTSVLTFSGRLTDTYGGLYRSTAKIKFKDGEIVDFAVLNYDSDYLSGGMYVLFWQITLAPHITNPGNSVNKTRAVYQKMKTTPVDMVRLQFGDGKLDFIPVYDEIFMDMISALEGEQTVKN